MRNVEGSLTKELPLSVIEQTIALARHGMAYSRFRALAETKTHRDAPGLVAARFLSLIERTIVRDHFLSLVENEGLGTARMRKILYGTWVLRDGRLRRYVLERIAGEDGKWRTGQITKKSNESFFREALGFQASSSPKIRSNIERFLVEVGIFDGASGVNLGLDDGWLDDAVRSAAELEADREKRLEMTKDPIAWIVREKLNGIANVTLQELQGVSSILLDQAEPTLDLELGDAAPLTGQGRKWKPRTQNFEVSRTLTFSPNPVARERASRAHYEMEKLLATRLEAKGRVVQCNENIDLYFGAERESVLVEVKSCHYLNFHTQVRRGVSQLLEYSYRYRDAIAPRPFRLVLAVETEPSAKHQWVVDFLLELKILIIWKSRDNSRLLCSGDVPDWLAGVVERA